MPLEEDVVLVVDEVVPVVDELVLVVVLVLVPTVTDALAASTATELPARNAAQAKTAMIVRLTFQETFLSLRPPFLCSDTLSPIGLDRESAVSNFRHRAENRSRMNVPDDTHIFMKGANCC